MCDEEQRHRETLWFAAYTGQMSLLWQQVSYIQITAAGTITAAWIAHARSLSLACAAILTGSLVQVFLVLLIRRHAQILEEFTFHLQQAKLVGQVDAYQSKGYPAHFMVRVLAGVLFGIGIIGMFMIALQSRGSDYERWLWMSVSTSALAMIMFGACGGYLKKIFWRLDCPPFQPLS